MITKPALFLDFDGTVRFSKSGGKFIKDVADIAIFEDVIPKLIEYKEKGFMIMGITNQGGAAFGYRTADQISDEIQVTLAAVVDAEGDPLFDAVETCLLHPGGTVPEFTADTIMRKPRPGMLVELEHDAAQFFDTKLDWKNSLMVGDRDEDRECAERGGVAFEWADIFFNRMPFQIGQKVKCLNVSIYAPETELFVSHVYYSVIDHAWQVGVRKTSERAAFDDSWVGPAKDFRAAE